MSRNPPLLTPLAIGLVAAALLAGCDKKTTTTSTPAGTATTTTVTPSPTASAVVSSAGTALTDTALTAKVKTALLADDNVKGLRIDVETANSVVTLNGTADTAANKERATTVARGVDGVKSVENRLTVKP